MPASATGTALIWLLAVAAKTAQTADSPTTSITGPAMPHRRSAFFVSDRTGITAESLGNTLLTQFDTEEFKRETVPFIDTVEKAQELARRIDEIAANDHRKPLV